MKIIIRALLIIIGITFILAVISIRVFPEWLSIPGGILILLGIFFNAVLDTGSKLKNWVDMLSPKKENGSGSAIHTSYRDISQQGGTNIIAAKIDHLEVHSLSNLISFKSMENNLVENQAELEIIARERKKDNSPHVEVVVINKGINNVFCRAKAYAVFNSSGENIKREISDYANYYSWSGGSDKGEKEIPAGLDGTINLIRINNAGYGMYFLFDENPHSYWNIEGIYKLDIEITVVIREDSKRIEFIGKRVIIEFEYIKSESQDAAGQVFNNGIFKLLTFKLL